MEDIYIQKNFFRPICSDVEIERIFNVQNAKDHLLKIRADTVVDHMRLFRVYRNKALRCQSNWSLEGSFADNHYKMVLEKLSPAEKEECENVCYGDIFSNNPNGMIFNTEFGPITTICDSLAFFLKFSHLALMDFKSEVPFNIRMNSLRIAIRVMLQTEAMDFYMDPRGIIPEDIASDIHSPISKQKQFIAGHEFAHHILGHLSRNNVKDQPIFFAIGKTGDDYKPQKAYSNSEKDEFEADIQSLMLPNYSDAERSDLLSAALMWFGCLELYETASDIMFPRSSFSPRTHPPARERYDNLLCKIPTPQDFETSFWKSFFKTLDEYIKILQEDISLNFDDYERYGSAYLDAPNTLWRGKELIDREDYY